MLPLVVDRESPRPMTVQIQTAIRDRVLDGTLHPGSRLPSSRHLALDLGVSRSVVVQAYEQMIAEGYLRAEQGSGTRVATHLPSRGAADDPRPAAPPQAVRFDLRAAATGMALFPRREWLLAYQNAVRSVHHSPMARPAPLGVGDLRVALASYLGRVRGVRAGGADVVVSGGTAHTLGTVCAALRDLGIDHLAVANPGDQRHVVAAARAGARLIPVPVDAHGLDVEALARTGARAVLVNPVAQVPTGAALSPTRRDALLRWAESVDGWVIEHDPDGHLWLGRGSGPLALQRLAPDRVVYAGSTSGMLGPCLRLGWFVAPPRLRAAIERAPAGGFAEPDSLTQLAFAEFVDRGLLDQHVRQLRGTHRARRAALRAAVAVHLPGSVVLGVEVGTHAYVPLLPGTDDVRLAALARARSVLVDTGRQYHLDRGRAEPALVIGYGAVEHSRLAEAVAILGGLRESRLASAG
ncbi:GntR family transcriptional regulator [Actinokineospora sp. NBRC 105648]|nr:GntR family transcriptional regulator [Actinokineospora sp. NBRC 105648]